MFCDFGEMAPSYEERGFIFSWTVGLELRKVQCQSAWWLSKVRHILYNIRYVYLYIYIYLFYVGCHITSTDLAVGRFNDWTSS